MFAVYLAVTLVAAVVNGAAAVANFAGHRFALDQADKMKVPRSWRFPLGACLAAGAVGLLAGFAMPVLGVVAAAGLVLYFVGAFGAHLRVRDRGFGPWSVYFAVAVAALVTNLAHYGGSA